MSLDDLLGDRQAEPRARRALLADPVGVEEGVEHLLALTGQEAFALVVYLEEQVRRVAAHAHQDLAPVRAELDGVVAPGTGTRASLLMGRILAIPDAEVGPVLEQTLARFRARHRGFEEILERHFELVRHHAGGAPLSRERRLLIGAYFTNEYSVEGAALFNPSIVPAPDQAGMSHGQRRFVMSLRAVGEGHISAIEFRTGVIDGASSMTFDPLGGQLVTGDRTPPAHYDKPQFRAKLIELDAGNELAWSVLDRLPNRFTPVELEQSLSVLEQEGPPHAISYETARIVRVLASSSYATTFPADSAVSERVIFPAGPHETHGMEDARFVLFTEDDGSVTYYATYTAFDGYEIVPQLIQTDDFISFRIATLNGPAAQNKGMALFPRRIPIATPNDLRRTFASWLKQAGNDSMVVAKLLGQSAGSAATAIAANRSRCVRRRGPRLLRARDRRFRGPQTDRRRPVRRRRPTPRRWRRSRWPRRAAAPSSRAGSNGSLTPSNGARSATDTSLRTHLLVQLNGHYEGQASGETFNFQGKTDILVRVQGKNIFIAECKIWRGEKALLETIDQLLGYTSWRDTKTAIIIFNRNKDFSAVLAKIRPVVESHVKFKRFDKQVSDTAFRFVFKQRNDYAREMVLTVLLFDVPLPTPSSAAAAQS